MKSARYDQLPLKIDGIDVLALNFSASQSASLEPVYTLEELEFILRPLLLRELIKLVSVMFLFFKF